MKNNIHDKNWDALGEKITNYVTDEYSNEDWVEMDKMLHQPNSSFIQFLNQYVFVGVSIIILVSATILFGIGFFSEAMDKRHHSMISASQNESETKSTSDSSEYSNATSTNRITNRQTIFENETKIGGSKNSKSVQQGETKTTIEATRNKNIASQNTTLKSSENSQAQRNRLRAAQYSKSTTKILKKIKHNIIPSNINLSANENSHLSTRANIEANNDLSNRLASDKETWQLSQSLVNNTMNANEIPNFLPSLNIQLFESKEYARIKIEEPAEQMIDTKFLDKRVQFGLLIGLNNTIIDLESATSSHTPLFGIFANKNLSEKWGIQLGTQIKYVRNYELEQTFSAIWFDHLGNTSIASLILKYDGYTAIDIPLSIQYKFFNRFFLVGGLRYTNLIHQRSGGKGSLTGSSITTNFDTNTVSDLAPKQGFWRHDLGITIGIIYKLTNHWSANLRLSQGFRDLTPDNLYQNDTQIHFNSDLQLNLKYTF